MDQRRDIEYAKDDKRLPPDMLKGRRREESKSEVSSPVDAHTDGCDFGPDVHGQHF